MILCSGTSLRDPETRAGKSSEFTIKHLDSGAPCLVRVLVFSDETRAEQAALGRGDALSVIGMRGAEIYASEGKDLAISFAIRSDRVTALRKKERNTSTVQRMLGGSLCEGSAAIKAHSA